MTTILTCPECRSSLRVPRAAEGADLFSCPRCLAEVRVGDEPGGIQERPSPSKEEAPSARCPDCYREISEEWSFCPYCSSPSREERLERRRDSSLDVDVRRDTKGTGGAMTSLAFLGAFIITIMLYGVFVEGDVEGLLGMVTILLFAGLISTGIVFYRTRHDPSQRSLQRILVGTLALTGGLFSVGCLLSVGIVIVMFLVCLAKWGTA